MTATQTVIDWSLCPVLESKPDTQGGAWVFRGTRVPGTAILRNLSELSVAELSQEFPTVRPEQITEVLEFVAQSAAPNSRDAEASLTRRKLATETAALVAWSRGRND